MENVLKITTIKDQQSDFEFWSTKSYSERLEAMETLRYQFIRMTQNVQPRLQRICRVINQKQR
jgi:hypothetical protein